MWNILIFNTDDLKSCTKSSKKNDVTEETYSFLWTLIIAQPIRKDITHLITMRSPECLFSRADEGRLNIVAKITLKIQFWNCKFVLIINKDCLVSLITILDRRWLNFCKNFWSSGEGDTCIWYHNEHVVTHVWAKFHPEYFALIFTGLVANSCRPRDFEFNKRALIDPAFRLRIVLALWMYVFSFLFLIYQWHIIECNKTETEGQKKLHMLHKGVNRKHIYTFLPSDSFNANKIRIILNI